MDTSRQKEYYVGIDVGSVSLSLVVIDSSHKIVDSRYITHHGNISGVLHEQLGDLNIGEIAGLAFNQRADMLFKNGYAVNDQVAVIEGLQLIHGDVRSLFTIGGETFGLILFDEQGRYQKYISNSSCAAGTGAFLDQQAERMGLAGSADLSRLAAGFSGTAPRIATRCAVFAKTDLIHSQQQGYSLAAISDGLCRGLARNIADTLLKGIKLQGPVYAVGGVARNQRVMHHLSALIDLPIHVPQAAETIPALGCALIARKNPAAALHEEYTDWRQLLLGHDQQKQYFFPPLDLKSSAYPDFEAHRHYMSGPVEVDLYHLPQGPGRLPVYLGIDVGSTSTKAVVMLAEDGQDDGILIGLYTRTRSQPVRAVQDLLRTLREIENRHRVVFEFRGVGSTGSGRKFVGKVISADLALDEITAHARAAVSLNPDTDTIIEIGGQDAKFTVLKDGQVTFSVMNYVCAAGTGSFIEEQARRLNVPLEEYAHRAFGVSSPLTSDRCTVFMERDLNHLLQQGYSREELLAASLHSVRDNYLSKVAHLNKIGRVICFQGATAKNKALVAAFEQRLQQPIFVSRYCHLTGALGVCLTLREEQRTHSSFRGIDFYKSSMDVQDDVCELCNNHCKLKVISLNDERVVWGYLCGRDESDNRPRRMNKSGFDLLSRRRRIFTPARDSFQKSKTVHERKSFFDNLFSLNLDRSLEKFKNMEIHVPADFLQNVNLEERVDKLRERFALNLLDLRHRLNYHDEGKKPSPHDSKKISIGLPNTLYMQEFMPLWRTFWKQLGYHVVVSRASEQLVTRGKEMSGAEFCMPISYWHGHVQALAADCDYMFLPHFIGEEQADDSRSLYCYYTNYASVMVQNIDSLHLEGRCLAPHIDFGKTAIYNIRQIYDSLPQELKLRHNPREIQAAFHYSREWFLEQQQQLIEIFRQNTGQDGQLSVIFLGRPYLVLDEVMNKKIPATFNKMGIKTFFQDMVPPTQDEPSPAGREFLSWNHWRFGRQILRAAEYVGRHDNVYAVYLTAFKCAPDSFILSYFREIMESYQKPYLVLQLDEHDSDVGYETRIEAAVNSFRNHSAVRRELPAHPYQSIITLQIKKGSTILVPNYDPLSAGLICAAFEHAGYHARLIDERPETVVSSLRINDGQCLPVSSIVQGAAETIRKDRKKLDLPNTFLFLNTITNLSCNFPQYPVIAQKMLQQFPDIGPIGIFATDFDMHQLPRELIFDVYSSYLIGGFLRKLACRVRPYELTPGASDAIIQDGYEKLAKAMAAGLAKEEIFEETAANLAAVPVSSDFGKRPKICIIGDLYVRDNDVFNQNLIRYLEQIGAEVVTTPFTYILRLLAAKQNCRFQEQGQYFNLLRMKLLVEYLERGERRFFQMANKILDEEFPEYDDAILQYLDRYNLSLEHGGETAQNIIKIYSILEHQPHIALFVHVNPIFCCPALVSEAIFKKVEKDIGIPIVSITYDGTTAARNETLAPYLHFIERETAE